jgi:Zn-dependent membrane protease YugP
MKVYANYNKYSQVQSRSCITGAEVARRILNANGLNHVAVQHVGGELSDHYDPGSKVIRLSDTVFDSTSLAAVAVAAHECGHAIQDAEEYQPMRIRSMIAPVANVATQISWIFLFAGIILGFFNLSMLGAYIFGAVVIFQLVTLPVELNASSRALHILENDGILANDEMPGAKKVLSAAALTYVAALVTAIVSMIRLILMALMYRRNRW